MSIFYPCWRFSKVEDIKEDFFVEHKIKGLIMDIDNTLVPWDEEPEKEVLDWINKMKSAGIKMCLLSNNHEGRVTYVGNKLELPILYSAKKPLSFGFKRAIKFLGMDKNNIAVIGDQIFTDVLGGNNNGLFTIFVTPRSRNEQIITKIKRPLEKFVLSRYEKSKEYNYG